MISPVKSPPHPLKPPTPTPPTSFFFLIGFCHNPQASVTTLYSVHRSNKLKWKFEIFCF